MDNLDHQIAEILRQDGRRSYRAIGTELGVSPRLVGTRVSAMVESGELEFAAIADVFAAGNDLMLAVGLAISGRATAAVAEELAAFDEVCAVNIVSGEMDLEVLILSQDHESLREFVGTRLARITGIQRLSPSLTLEVFKFDQAPSDRVPTQ